MMRMIRGWTGLRLAAIALGLLGLSTPRAHANATTSNNLLGYSVAGQIDSNGITGTNVISYVPVQNVQIDPTSNLPLGSFQVAPLPTGQTTTYDNTKFSLTFDPTSFNTKAVDQTVKPLMVTGELNGSVTGPYQSSVKVTFDPITQGSFALAGGTSTLSVLQNDHKLLVPSSASGITTLEGQLSSTGISPDGTPAPEPSTIALFLSMVGGLGLRRYVMTRRQRVPV
jgi:hypothetical protein